jgi:hypothetical protein
LITKSLKPPSAQKALARLLFDIETSFFQGWSMAVPS